jgi:hypothetical protein
MMCVTLVSSLGAVVLTLCLMLHWSGQRHDVEAALNQTTRALIRNSALPPKTATLPQFAQLPPFASAEFAGQLAAVVNDAGLRSDEVTYLLEPRTNQPFWRYRVSLQVQSGYPTIRKFLAAMSFEFPNVVLDAIHCNRENSTSATLKCELALTAFFAKSAKNG